MIATRRRCFALLSSTVLALAATPASAAFDPNAGATLPDTKVLYSPGHASAGTPTLQPVVTPLYPTRAMLAPAPAAAPAVVVPAPASPPAVAAAAAPEPTGFIAPAPVLAAAPAAEPITLVPPVTSQAVIVPAAPAVAAQETTATNVAVVPMQPAGSPPANASVAASVHPESVVAAGTPDMQPSAPVLAAPLTDESKTILSHVPSKLDAPAPQRVSSLKVERTSPDVAAVLGKDSKVEAYEAVGLSIKVRRPGLDVNYELNRAYTALMGGDTQTAIQIYSDILSTQPTNQDALFGLASTYHRAGNLDKARPIYGMLLKVNPNHREGLNNFLALISDESPQEALAELERLEQRNPDFSPIPAQEAIVLDKLGYVEESRAKMLRAIDLAPDNLTYKYNLAVMSDRNGNYADAGALYRLLIDASLKGAAVPAPVEQLQKRLNYITTVAATDGKAIGG